jgi:hypothetical protein
MWIINLWFNILSHAAIFWVQTWVEVWYKFILIFFNKLHMSGFELETSDSDTMLDYYTSTSSAKSLS